MDYLIHVANIWFCPVVLDTVARVPGAVARDLARFGSQRRHIDSTFLY